MMTRRRLIYVILAMIIFEGLFMNLEIYLEVHHKDKQLRNELAKSFSPSRDVTSLLLVEQSKRWRLVQELESFNLTYFIYDDSNITQQNEYKSQKPDFYDRYCHEVQTEHIIHQELFWHPLRVDDPNDAELFIVPIKIGELLTTFDLSWDKPFQALISHPFYKKHQGNKHITISLPLVTYQYFNKHNVPEFLRWLPSISNVTAALGYDPVAVSEAYQRGEYTGNDYEVPFSQTLPMSHHSFSIGIGNFAEDFPITPASITKFQGSKHFIFYNTASSSSFYNSTRFRHAPVLDVNLTALPYSSIQMDPLSKEEWLSRYSDSKFCLAIRGDNPQSHALLRSVRAGCIPVVISDLWSQYAPCLKSSLQIEQYSIMVKKADFIANPQKKLLELAEIPNSVIEEKLAYLSLAQRVLLPDHSESLFVPAFLKEAMIAMKKTSPAFF